MTRINTNSFSLVALGSLYKTQLALSRSLTQWSTGYRINRASDDPAGAIAAAAIENRISELDAAITVNNRTDLMLDTADSSLAQMSKSISDIRALAVASANTGALSQEQLQANQAAIDAAVDAVNRISSASTFGGTKLFDGKLEVTASPQGQTLAVPAVNSATLGQPGSNQPGVTGDQTLDSIRTGGANSLANGGAAAVTAIADQAAKQLATLEAKVGAFQTYGLEGTNEVLADTRRALVAARSEIVDADYAQVAAQTNARQIAMKSGLMALAMTSRTQSSLLDLFS